MPSHCLVAIEPQRRNPHRQTPHDDDLRRIPETIRLSRQAYAVLWQNIGMALGFKAIFFATAITGHATMWMAVFADIGTTLIVIANSLRMLRWRK